MGLCAGAALLISATGLGLSLVLTAAMVGWRLVEAVLLVALQLLRRAQEEAFRVMVAFAELVSDLQVLSRAPPRPPASPRVPPRPPRATRALTARARGGRAGEPADAQAGAAAGAGGGAGRGGGRGAAAGAAVGGRGRRHQMGDHGHRQRRPWAPVLARLGAPRALARRGPSAEARPVAAPRARGSHRGKKKDQRAKR
jgi:hypothetical protein